MWNCGAQQFRFLFAQCVDSIVLVILHVIVVAAPVFSSFRIAVGVNGNSGCCSLVVLF